MHISYLLVRVEDTLACVATLHHLHSSTISLLLPITTMDALDVPVIVMSAPHPSNPVQHFPELCTTCTARLQRHQIRNNRQSSVTSTIESRSDSVDSASQLQPATYEFTLEAQESPLEAPPAYSRRRRYQRLDVYPPSYSDIVAVPPPGVSTTTIPVTIRYTENLILEDDGYSKVVCPTARKYKAFIRVYDTMGWDRFWECLRQVKPTVTTRESGLKDVRALERKGKWERIFLTRMPGVRLKEGNWDEVRTALCNGDMNKVVVSV